MNESVLLAIGVEMIKKMEKANTKERVEQAQTVEEKTAIVQETEKFVFEVGDDVFKSDEEIGEEGLKVKNEFFKEAVAFQYVFFELPNPFENGTTFNNVLARNGFQAEDEEFFTKYQL